MADNIRCELWHAFDGHCCADNEACPCAPRKIEPAVHVAAVHAATQQGMLMGVVALTVISAVFAFGLLLTEADLARHAKTNQENIAWSAQ